MDSMQNLSIEPGYFLIQGCVDIDKSHIRIADYKSTPDVRKTPALLTKMLKKRENCILLVVFEGKTLCNKQ